MTDVSYIKNTWDNREELASDWILNWDDESVIKEVEALPDAPKRSFILNQYNNTARYTSCTKFAPMNGLRNDMWYKWLQADVLRIEQKSIEAWWAGPWSGWDRWSGVNILRKDWNELNPLDKVASAITSIFSKLFWVYLKKWRSVVVSIRPDSAFWADVISDGRLDNADFGIGSWHATTIKQEDWVFKFIDSVWSRKAWLFDGRTYEFTEAQLQSMINNRTFRSDCHIFIPLNIIKMIATDVPEWQFYSEPVRWAIKKKITTETNKFRPSDLITRWEAITWLYRALWLNDDWTPKT